MMIFQSIKAIERLPEESGFYFCIVRDKKNKYAFFKTTLRFGDLSEEEDDEDDRNFYSNCDCIIENDRITWLEEIIE